LYEYSSTGPTYCGQAFGAILVSAAQQNAHGAVTDAFGGAVKQNIDRRPGEMDRWIDR
jgi:hypothetical protein